MNAEPTSLETRVEHKIAEVLAEPIAVPPVTAVPSAAQIASMIDHTLLKADATEAQVTQLCQEARAYGFGAVCVNAAYVGLCRELLADTEVEIAAVAGFPLGATLPEVKTYEAQRAIAAGATEIDMVLAIGALKDRRYGAVLRDVETVAQACHALGAVLKVIIEAAMLTDEEKVAACVLSQLAGADFCKTSTGFGPGGATLEDVALMRRTIGPELGLKAAGGIRTYADAIAMIAAGATRIGASAGVTIVEGARAKEHA
ncbi:MAG: deoxyribose-phosphate aldolase [Anaerolineae bacterium]|nr:deoxyribose-phosphate aldolase [Anaerolineae bacterium]